MVVKVGTFGNDLLIGSNANDTLLGSFGNDELRGLGGDDVLAGGGDDDTLNGGAGNDDLYADSGTDTAVFDTADNATINFGGFYGTADSWSTGFDLLYDIENITTGSGSDDITGSEVRNRIDAGGGNDGLLGYGGNDTLYGRSGIDDVDGGEGNDFLDGGADDDWLLGDQGNDRLVGGDGDDELNGDDWSGSAGLGVDRLTGGDGGDTFAFHVGQSRIKFGQRHIVTDFDATEGDIVRLHGFDPLAFIGTDVFSAADQVRFQQSGGNNFVQISTDPDSAVEMAIQFTGTTAFQASDFLFA
jgi:Ca2+-binding RTX toxin-like protein